MSKLVDKILKEIAQHKGDEKDVIQRWTDIGFIDESVPEDEQATLAYNYENAVRYLLEFDLETWMFPIIRRISKDYKNEKIDFVRLISAFAQAYDNYLNGGRTYPEDADPIAEMCVEVVKIYGEGK